MLALINSAFGRSCKAVRDNEIAAQTMGINTARVKVISFTISSFIAGIGGALLGHLMKTIDPKMFSFSLSYNIVLIVVLGGSGSISGSAIAAIVVTVSMEALRFLDGPLNLIFVQTQGLPGLRMVVFSVLLLLVIIYRQQGLMGNREFSWNLVLDSPLAKKLESRVKRGSNSAHSDSNSAHGDSNSAQGGGHA
jgi:branched-chain amino acid transport system permease protein